MALIGIDPVSPTLIEIAPVSPEIAPVSPASLAGRASSEMGIYCLTSVLNDAHHSLVSKSTVRSESMYIYILMTVTMSI